MQENTFVALEVTPKEMEEILQRRESAAKDAAIKEKAVQIARLIKEIEDLGGHVGAARKGRSTYFSTCGERVIGVRQPYSRQVDIVIT